MATKFKNSLRVNLLITMLLVGFSLKAQTTEEAQKMIYDGYIINSETLQKEAVKKLQERYDADKTNTENLYQLLEAQYILLNGTMAAQNEALFDDYIDEAVDNAKEMLDRDKNHAKTKGLLSALYGLRIAYSPMKGMFLGSKSSSLAEEAIGQKSEPLAWLKYAGNKYNTPETWGGDKQEALKSFKKAVDLFESNQENLNNNYHYLDALAWLGIAYKNAGEVAKAKQQFEKALAQEPDFSLVKYALLPNTEKALANQ